MGNPDSGRGAVGNPDNPGTRERLRTAGPFLLDGLLAVVMAAAGFALLAPAPGLADVEALTNVVRHSPGPGGGFRVVASLPVGDR